ncbi:MAG: S-methyl-5'-thioadenosine phosphorylase [Anaerolineae bacterium]|nr:S-methyl-5'-thioadenosine phosphorylase [Anaerolineae bacterium]MCB9131827.1 S-methyl-5'-thioadenosine phosphorylase [Anaerolineales bacterium]MCB0239470.1 S-methyl-5'-thioadenosine phosphorylase [Anaerolineae bacterium]MCB0246596.1 S-methyl-5'-thioadenosine phosphorylase [Anaerolineae bacterium]MCB0249440.1 S-methyl-5'-thioadenosine phosphorylase [Anaerolineae bacterium]
MEPVRIGVLGGTGVYELSALKDVEEITLDTPFGAPSDSYIIGTMDGQRVAFLSRHGRGHRISPTQLNSRANIWGFKKLGVEYLIAVSACGSLQEQIHPGDFVVPDQLYDRTRLRPLSYFDDPAVGTQGVVIHVSVANPFCEYTSEVCYRAVQQTGTRAHFGGTYVTIEGPRFSTKAESRIFRQLGISVVGMTTVPEAFLAREAEMSYAVMAHVTDYDVWHEGEGPVTVEAIIRMLNKNTQTAREAVRRAVGMLAEAGPSPQRDALKDGITTHPDLWPAEARQQLELILGKYMTT